ncbi:MAG TPA: iron-containing alcohol dehydrogenase [Bryobacteraceae bacterium]|nr:iron-containing alcohol dehydrogenase [Bryobacteraceae bacterium]
MRFEFATATRIVFGAGTVREVVPAAREMGSRVLLVTGKNPDRAAPIEAELGAHAIRIAGEPTLDVIREGLEQARGFQADVVIAFGGGSAIDAGKAIAAMATNPGDLLDYLEVIGAGKPLVSPPLPFIAVPTTAGTGSEVTRNAVLSSPEPHVKVSLRSPQMLPRLAVVDPGLTVDLPQADTASTGLDALTQVIEPFVSIRANVMTDGFCREGMRRAVRSLQRAYLHGDDLEARTDMSIVSLLSGLALANAGLGAVHGFAAPIGGAFDAPHGAICAALLPHATAVNIQALRSRAPDSEPLRRYGAVAQILTNDSAAIAGDAPEWLAKTCRALAIAPLRTYGIRETDIDDLVSKASRASSMKANPIVLTDHELHEVLERAI